MEKIGSLREGKEGGLIWEPYWGHGFTRMETIGTLHEGKGGRMDREMEGITGEIIGAAFEVSNVLGHGFLERIYRKAMAYELDLRALAVREEAPFDVIYKGKNVGKYYSDIVVENKVIVELKAIERLSSAHVGQVLNYLKSSGLRVALLFNFGKPKVEYRRILL